MCLALDSDAAYLVQPNARSRFAGYFYLADPAPPPPVKPTPKLNGPVLVECKTLRGVLTSAAEAETGGVFHNGQTAIVIQRALEALGHKQPPTPLKTDNSTAHSFVHTNIRQRRSKTWDMRWNWLRDKSNKALRVYWEKGSTNDADYFTKHHPPNYHRQMRPRYILQEHNISTKIHPFHFRLTCARVCSSLFRPPAVTSASQLPLTIVQFPIDNGKTLVDNIISNDSLGASDGSCMNNTFASYAVKLSPREAIATSPNHFAMTSVHGVDGAPGHIASLRAESRGAIASILLCLILYKNWPQKFDTVNKLTINFDNKTVIKRFGTPPLERKDF
jgi:hypothetical protein